MIWYYLLPFLACDSLAGFGSKVANDAISYLAQARAHSFFLKFS